VGAAGEQVGAAHERAGAARGWPTAPRVTAQPAAFAARYSPPGRLDDRIGESVRKVRCSVALGGSGEGSRSAKTPDAAPLGLSIPQLEALAAIVDYGSFTAASDVLRISQPALSRRI